jgi:hypothetical protein
MVKYARKIVERKNMYNEITKYTGLPIETIEKVQMLSVLKSRGISLLFFSSS